MRTLTIILALAMTGLLTGCISMPKNGGPLTNHIVTTIDDARCMTASRWWLFAVTADVSDAECAALLEALRWRHVLRHMATQR